MINVCGIAPRYLTNWFVCGGQVGTMPGDRVGIRVPLFMFLIVNVLLLVRLLAVYICVTEK